MKRRTTFFHRKPLRLLLCLLMITGALGLVSCSSSEEEDFTTVSIMKDGTVKSHISESFEQPYYDKDGLQQSVLSEAASYNRTAGQNHVTVEKVEMAENQIIVEMTYAEAEDYAAFNQVIFFVGTPGEAEAEGYDLNVVLSDVKDPQATVGKADILAMKDVQLLITDIPETVLLNGRVLYSDDGVAVSGNRKSCTLKDESEGPAYIIFK